MTFLLSLLDLCKQTESAALVEFCAYCFSKADENSVVLAVFSEKMSEDWPSDVESEWASDVPEEFESDDDFVENEDFAAADIESSDNEDENIPQQINPLDYVIFGETVTVDVAPRFGLTGVSHFIGFRDQDGIVDAEEVARAAFDKILSETWAAAGPRDLVGVSIDHPCLDHEILVLFGDRTETTTDKIMDVIARVKQSKKELDFDSTMEVKVTRITPPEGSGYWKMAKGRFKDCFQRHSGGHGSVFIEIKNNDWLCFPRAVVVARARVQYHTLGDKSVKWSTIKRGDAYRCTLQRMLALDLATRAGLLGNRNRSCGIDEFKKVQKLLIPEGFQLKIFSHDHFDARIFDEELPGLIPLYLYHHDNHFTPMTSPRVLTGTSYYCDVCNRGYSKKEQHNCPAYCSCCKTQGQCPETRWIQCNECSRRFKSQQCFDNHLLRPEKFVLAKNNKRRKVVGQSTCMKVKLCLQCGRTMSKSRLPPQKHRCGLKYCSLCKVWDENDVTHQCYMQPIKTRKQKMEEADLLPEELEIETDDLDALVREEEERQGETEATRNEHFRQSGNNSSSEVSKYLFWDFETTQQDEYDQGKNILGPSYLHKPNYCIVRKACMLCKDFWLSRCENPQCKAHSCEQCQKSKPNCQICKEHYARFYGEMCKEDFCDFLFREHHRDITAIAHNSKGFDAHFIIRWLVDQKRIPKIIPRGLKVLSIEAMGVKVIDSISFLPQSLESLPKTMNEPELKKGYFPYLFCRSENWQYVGLYPDADQYCPSRMKPEARDSFYKWYNAHKDGIFDFQKELREYTESDVDILLRCVLKFNDLFHAETGVYPLEVAITIAQACNHVFRKNFLKENTIGIVPRGGYRGHERQSKVALEWIKFMSESLGVYIRHARNGKEKTVGKYKADGFFGNTVLEFNGCAFHGCRKCYKKREEKVPNSSLTREEAYQKTIEKAEYIRKQGYHLIEMWECEWERLKRSDPEIKKFINNLELTPELNARKALAGGRTNAAILWKKCKPGERIDYYDICSLYPWVCKYCAFPLKHPKVITENFQKITKGNNPYFGLICCRVLAPRGLLHPLLPYRYNNRLNFACCRTCLEQGNQKTCEHNDSERSFTSTFVSIELDKALELDYQVMEVYEVWHYDERAVYDGENENSGLFTEYINKFLKLKQQASGWPSWVKTEADKDRYIQEYEEKEGIQLDPDQIEKNAGLRAVAKLCLNSFWGKFAQRSDFNNVELFSDPNSFYDVVFDRENQVSTVRSLGPDMVAVNYKKGDEHEKVNPNTSVVLACFVTAHARLKLYSYIEKLQDRVIYYDTDSVIFLTKPGDSYVPPIGDYLGDLTDELAEYGNGSYISEFVSGGPKQYSFRVKNPVSGKTVKTVTKVKGFSLNYTNAAHINFKRMKRQVKGFVKHGILDQVTVYEDQIRRTKQHEIVTTPTSKVQKVVYCKRVIMPDFSTRPFGY